MKSRVWERLGDLKRRLLVTGGMAMISLSNTITAFAEDKDDDKSVTGFLDDTPTKDIFKDVTETVESAGASLYKLLMVVGVIGFVVSLIFAGLSLAFTRNSNKRGEEKSNLLWIFVGMVVVFGAMAIIGLAQNVGVTLNNTPTS